MGSGVGLLFRIVILLRGDDKMDSMPLVAGSRARLMRRGFTLVELLVVIAIIGILVALLLPAIQAAREAARRNDCRNHLRQFGVAAQNYVSTHKSFPTGGLGWGKAGDPNLGFGVEQPACWMYSILPYIEYGEVHSLGKGLSVAKRRPFIKIAIETVIPLYFCPTRRRPESVPFVHGTNYENADRPTVIVRNDYVASSGSDGAGNQPYSITVAAAVKDRSLSKNGITLCGIAVKMKNVTDGTSKTLLYGEKALNTAYIEVLGGDDDNDQGWNLGYDWDIIRWTAAPPTPDLKFTNKGDWGAHKNEFGATHTSGMQCVMADASVHSISYEINRNTFRILGSRNDGLPLDAGWSN